MYVSIKVPTKLHTIIKWLALQKGKYIYELLAELVLKEVEGK